MITPLVLSFDLDDTLWPVGPLMIAAESAMLVLAAGAPPGHHAPSRRDLDAGAAHAGRRAIPRAQSRHDLPARSALAQMFTDAGHDETHADEAFEVFFTARNRVQLL